MSDTHVRAVSIAEHAAHAALIAASTLQHAENPHQPGTDEYLKWDAAYKRHFDALTSPEGEGSA